MLYSRTAWEISMAGKGTHVVIPDEVVEEIDRLVGKRGRSKFLVSAARTEVKRLRLLKALQDASGSWKDEDHPELQNGAALWVSQLRWEDNNRRGNGPKR